MNESSHIAKFFAALGAWGLCVLTSVAASWAVSQVFGFHFDAAAMVVLSSALVATMYLLHRSKII